MKLQIHSRQQTPAYRGQTNKYLPSTFVEVRHSSAEQSVEPVNLTNRLANQTKQAERRRSRELLIN